MKHQGDSSILKSLAVAFGDGLAFGVGVKIAQTSARKRSNGMEPPAAAQTEPAEPLDLQVLSKVLAAIDARLSQSEAQVAAELKAVDARQAAQNSQAQAALEEIHCSMMERVAAVEQGAQTVETRLAGTIEKAVEARIRQYVDARAEAIEQRLREDITATGDRTAKLLVETIDARLLGRIGLLERELRGQAETIRSLREMLGGIGRACQEAAAEQEKKPERPGESGAGPEASAEIAPPDTEDRRYDSLKLINPPRAERKLPIPLVSSLAVLLLGMAALAS